MKRLISRESAIKVNAMTRRRRGTETKVGTATIT